MDSRKSTQTPRMDRKTLILTVVGALLVIAIIVIAVVLMQRSSVSAYEESYNAAMESYVAGDYSGAIESARLAYSADATEDALLIIARSHAALGDYDSAVAALEPWVAEHGSGEEAGSLLEEYRSLAGGEPSETPDAGTVEIGGQSFSRDTDTVVLADTPLSGADLEAVAGLESLTSLSLNGCSLTDISALAACEGLTALSLEDNAIEDVSALSGLRSLRALYLSGNPLGSLEPLYRLDSLTTLDIRGREITGEEFAALAAELPGCTILSDEPSAAVTEITLGGITFTSDVTELDLSGRQISDISPLSACTSLVSLDLSDNAISSVSVLAGMPNLRSLDLSNNEISNLSPLIALTGLESLDVSGNAVGNVSALSGHTALRELRLDGNPLASLDPLGSLSGLASLSLRDTGVTDNMLAPLYQLTGLASLDLGGGNSLSGAAADALIAALPNCSVTVPDGIYTVELGGFSFPADAEQVDASNLGLADLAGAERFTQLKALFLNGNEGIDISNISALTGLTALEARGCGLVSVTPLGGLGALESLDLIGNDITDLSPLRHLANLRELHLSMNANLRDLTPLANLDSLETLSLNGTSVTDLSPLAGLTGLETLDIEGCRIGSIEPLLGLTNLKTLYAAGCGLTPGEIETLGAALPQCTIYS